jgi:hypothetical protein
MNIEQYPYPGETVQVYDHDAKKWVKGALLGWGEPKGIPIVGDDGKVREDAELQPQPFSAFCLGYVSLGTHHIGVTKRGIKPCAGQMNLLGEL